MTSDAQERQDGQIVWTSPVLLVAKAEWRSTGFLKLKKHIIPSTALRFFPVYGPAGRPDMAYYGFTNKLKNNEIIKIF